MSMIKVYDPFGLVKEFNKAFEVTNWIDEPDAYGRMQHALLRLKLIREEFGEVADELLDTSNDCGALSKLAKELADLLYVTYHTAATFDIPIYEVFEAVHTSNMSKLENGKPVLREDGKILKGRNYKEPDIESILFGNGVSG